MYEDAIMQRVTRKDKMRGEGDQKGREIMATWKGKETLVSGGSFPPAAKQGSA